MNSHIGQQSGGEKAENGCHQPVLAQSEQGNDREGARITSENKTVGQSLG